MKHFYEEMHIRTIDKKNEFPLEFLCFDLILADACLISQWLFQRINVP